MKQTILYMHIGIDKVRRRRMMSQIMQMWLLSGALQMHIFFLG